MNPLLQFNLGWETIRKLNPRLRAFFKGENPAVIYLGSPYVTIVLGKLRLRIQVTSLVELDRKDLRVALVRWLNERAEDLVATFYQARGFLMAPLRIIKPQKP